MLYLFCQSRFKAFFGVSMLDVNRMSDFSYWYFRVLLDVIGSVRDKWQKASKSGSSGGLMGGKLADCVSSIAGGVGGAMTGPRINSAAMLYAAKKNDYERVKILFRYGYRLERMDKITDPLKRIELFKAVTSPAYIITTLENTNDVSSDFFCPVKKCFEFACEASQKGKSMPEYKREYQEIEHR